jgi:hypothetical protein
VRRELIWFNTYSQKVLLSILSQIVDHCSGAVLLVVIGQNDSNRSSLVMPIRTVFASNINIAASRR